VREHEDRLYSIALRVLGDPRDAEEAAQDAFVRAYRALAGYDAARIGELRLRPWLATIVLNLCRSRLARRGGTRGALSLDLALPGELEPRAEARRGPAETAVVRDSGRDWAALLMSLPAAYRSAVVLRHVDGLSYPELAAALDRPEGTVKAQVHRGLALLRTAYEAAERRDRERMTA
jgi:RNA polymerase sigma-70 factor (ECF subfamily)